MKKIGIIGIIGLCLLAPAGTVRSQTPAFPGAEGGGMYATGGRGGAVYSVNTLEDNEHGNKSTREGSLRWCLKQPGSKTVLFKVSGTIRLNKPLRIGEDNLTLAGQSAPGDGICLADYPVAIDASNVIIRYIRFRMGDEKVTPEEAGGADALNGKYFENVIIDHCSVSWCTDECASFYDCKNFTLQWCIISESLRLSKHFKGPHGYGGIWGGVNSTFHHNLLAHHESRNPRLGMGVTPKALPLEEATDLRNNVIYNWSMNSCYGGEAMRVNLVNNYYKPGPATPQGKVSARIVAIDKDVDHKESLRYNLWGKFYIHGNVVAGTDKYAQATNKDNWNNGVYNQFSEKYGTLSEKEKKDLRADKPFETGPVTTQPAEEAYRLVLASAGASLYRDAVDARIVEEVRTGTTTFTGKSDRNGYTNNYPGSDVNWKSKDYPKPGIIDSQNDLRPEKASGNRSAWPELKQAPVPVDNNADGIPDGWLDTNYPGKKATDTNEQGYTYLEVYLNELVAQAGKGINAGIIVVDRAGRGHFRTVQQALDSVRAFNPAGITTIFIREGIYKEKLELPTHVCNVRLVGENRDKTVITYDDHANINRMGTFRTYTFLIRGNDITLENLTVENSAPQLGQAVALHVEGDRIVFRNCRFLGNQDTIYTGRENSRQYFENCYIEGTTDYIFGPSTAWFEGCELYCKRNSYITAASTPEHIACGYIFNRCTIRLAEGVDAEYLGRPWRAHAMTLFMNTVMPEGIRAEGWHNWGKTENESTARYMEYNNTGKGAAGNGRVSWAKQLSAAEAQKYTVEKVLKGSDGWKPRK